MSSSELASHGICRRSDCPASIDGTNCILGHQELLECPEFEPIDSHDELLDVDAVPEDLAVEPNGSSRPQLLDVRGRNRIVASGLSVNMYLGDALRLDEASLVLGERPAIVVVPVGPVSVGKTTLLAAIWELVCAGNAGHWSFAESLTPYAFEERCYLASMYSGRAHPDTNRTSESVERMFLHLALWSQVDGEGDSVAQTRKDLLLADVSGEHADTFVRANEAGPLLSLLQAADIVPVLVDGALLGGAGHWVAISSVCNLLRVIVERVRLKSHARLLLIVTKWDQCSTSPDISTRLERLALEANEIVGGIDILRCAARSEAAGNPKEGEGVAELIASLLNAVLPSASVAQPTDVGSRSIHFFTHGSASVARLAF